MLLVDQLGLEGYGIFWILIETLREQDGYRAPMAMLPILARKYNTSTEKMRAVVTGYGLFIIDEDDGTFASAQLLRRMGEYDALVEKKRLAGAAGGRKKAEKSQDRESESNRNYSTTIADAKQMPSNSEPGAKHQRGTTLPIREDRIGEDCIGEDRKGAKQTDSHARAVVGRADGDVYEQIGNHTITVGMIRGFLNQKFTQDEIDDVVDGLMIYQNLDTVNNIGAFMGSWLRKRRDDPKPAPGRRVGGIPCRLYTVKEVDQLKLHHLTSIVRIEGISACRSARDKPVLLALNTDIDRLQLARREPKMYGSDWPD